MGMRICREYRERDVELRYDVYTLRRGKRKTNYMQRGVRFACVEGPMRSTERQENESTTKKAGKRKRKQPRKCTGVDTTKPEIEF